MAADACGGVRVPAELAVAVRVSDVAVRGAVSWAWSCLAVEAASTVPRLQAVVPSLLPQPKLKPGAGLPAGFACSVTVVPGVSPRAAQAVTVQRAACPARTAVCCGVTRMHKTAPAPRDAALAAAGGRADAAVAGVLAVAGAVLGAEEAGLAGAGGAVADAVVPVLRLGLGNGVPGTGAGGDDFAGVGVGEGLAVGETDGVAGSRTGSHDLAGAGLATAAAEAAGPATSTAAATAASTAAPAAAVAAARRARVRPMRCPRDADGGRGAAGPRRRARPAACAGSA